MIDSYIGIFDLNRKLVEKQSKENFVKKNRRFVYSGIVKTCDELDLCDLPWPLYLSIWPEGHRQYPARP